MGAVRFVQRPIGLGKTRPRVARRGRRDEDSGMRAVVACVMLTGCVQWTAPEMQRKRIPLAAPSIALRTDQLPGTGMLLSDGTFRFQVDRVREAIDEPDAEDHG